MKDKSRRAAELDHMDVRIINNTQGGFPIEPRPFKKWATELGLHEDELIERLRRLNDTGMLSRFGPILNPRALGGDSVLVATTVPEDRFDELVDVINSYDEVSHNYEREHDLNVWFVVSSESRQLIEQVLADISERTGLKLYPMPKLEEYFLRVNFQLEEDDARE